MKSSDIETFGIGVGAYYGMSYGLLFYPALVVGVQTSSFCRDYLGQAVGDGHVWGIIAAIAFCFFIMILQAQRNWKPILAIYAITLWPFINLIRWIWHTDEYGNFSSIPFPGLNWFPLLPW